VSGGRKRRGNDELGAARVGVFSLLSLGLQKKKRGGERGVGEEESQLGDAVVQKEKRGRKMVGGDAVVVIEVRIRRGSALTRAS